MDRKLCICGHFGFGKELLNGQTIKTKIVAAELDRVYGPNNVIKIDTAGGVKALPLIWWRAFWASSKCDNIITLLSDNGLQAVMPVFVLCKYLFRNRISHLCLGAELSRYLKRRPWVGKIMHKVDCLYAETNVLKRSLNECGYSNVAILPNCKHTFACSRTAMGIASLLKRWLIKSRCTFVALPRRDICESNEKKVSFIFFGNPSVKASTSSIQTVKCLK